jgi:hypothetical protein
MFWNKKSEPRRQDGPLDGLELALASTNLKVQRSGNTLRIDHGNYATTIDVVMPTNPHSPNGPIKYVFQIRTALPPELAPVFARPEATVAMNSMATLGALTTENGRTYIGSRLTVYEAEQAWNIQAPLILLSAIAGGDSLFGAIRRAFSGESGRNTGSAWTANDFAQVHAYLSKMCVCNPGDDGFTAEFGIRAGSGTAITGDHHTALWTMNTDQPHPEAGGGLFCLLQMPHQIDDEARRNQAIARLNQMEMVPGDLPPHFGAWCCGNVGNPAYISFLLNDLHDVSGIAVNMSIWAMVRANWASGMLASMGIRV